MGAVGALPSKLAMVTIDLLNFLTVGRDVSDPLPRLKHIDFTVNEFHDEEFTAMVLSRQKTLDQANGFSFIALKLAGVGLLSETRFFGFAPTLRKSMVVQLKDLKGCAITHMIPPTMWQLP